MPSGIVTRHLVITGLVQGVWYRESLREVADSLGVTGWARNRLDGSVEAMLQGEAEQVDTLVEWCRRGPPLARVNNVEVSEGDGDYDRFEKRPTA
jgi:acylphosphatase